MKRLRWLLAGIVLIGLFLLFIGFRLGPEDSCLDSGGCWDSIDNVCRMTESNAQELCNRSGTK